MESVNASSESKKQPTSKINPLSLLECLRVLLNANGGIKNVQSLMKVVGLMGKYSRKLVSKCMYLNILSATERSILDLFYDEGGWKMVAEWLCEGISKSNWPLSQLVLDLLHISPITLTRLQVHESIMVKQVKLLTIPNKCPDQKLKMTAIMLIQQWGQMLKEATPTPVTQEESVLDATAGDSVTTTAAPVAVSADTTQASTTVLAPSVSRTDTTTLNSPTVNGALSKYLDNSMESSDTVGNINSPSTSQASNTSAAQSAPPVTKTIGKSKLKPKLSHMRKVYPSRVKSLSAVKRQVTNHPNTRVIDSKTAVLVSTPSPLAIVQHTAKALGKGATTSNRGRKRKQVSTETGSDQSTTGGDSPVKPNKITIKNGEQVLAQLSYNKQNNKSGSSQKSYPSAQFVASDDAMDDDDDEETDDDRNFIEEWRKKPKKVSPNKVKKTDSDEDFVVEFNEKTGNKQKKAKKKPLSPVKPVKRKIKSIIITSDEDSCSSLPDVEPPTKVEPKIEVTSDEASAKGNIKLENNKEEFKIKTIRTDATGKIKHESNDRIIKVERSDSVASDASSGKKNKLDSQDKRDKSTSDSKHQKDRSKSSDKYRSDSDKKREHDREKKNSSSDRKNSSHSSKDRDKYSDKHRDKSKDKDRYRDKDRSRDKDYDRRKEKDNKKDHIKDKEQLEKDKSTLEKVKPLSTDGMAKIPKKPASFLDALGSADAVGGTTTGESQLKKPPIKIKSHGFRSTGLLDPPSGALKAPGVAGKRTVGTSLVKPDNKYGLKKDLELGNTKRQLEEGSVAASEKRFKSTISSVPHIGDRPGGSKLISPKRPSLSDDGGFMAALESVSTKHSSEAKRKMTMAKKRRSSSESGGSMDDSTPVQKKGADEGEEEGAKAADDIESASSSAAVTNATPPLPQPLNFYRDTLEDLKTDDSKVDESSSTAGTDSKSSVTLAVGDSKSSTDAGGSSKSSTDAEGDNKSSTDAGGDSKSSTDAGGDSKSSTDAEGDKSSIDAGGDSKSSTDAEESKENEAAGKSSVTVKDETVEDRCSPSEAEPSNEASNTEEEAMDVVTASNTPSPAPPQEVYEKIEVMFSDRSGRDVKSALVLVRRPGPKKSVKFRPDEELERMHYFELDTSERVNVNAQKFQDMLMMEKFGEREAVSKQGRPTHTQYGPWKLLPIHLPDTVTVVVPGGRSQERHIQANREYNTIATFFHPNRLPDTPTEPDPEVLPRTEPKIIPLHDTSGAPDSVKNLKGIPWPAPMMAEPTPPTPPPSASFQYPPYHQNPMGGPQPGPPPPPPPPAGYPGDLRPGMPPDFYGGGGGPDGQPWVMGNNSGAGGPMINDGQMFNHGGPPHGYPNMGPLPPGGPMGDMNGPMRGYGPPNMKGGPPGNNWNMGGGGQIDEYGGRFSRDGYDGGNRFRGGMERRGRGGRGRGWRSSHLIPCRHFLAGHCRNGDECAFLHQRPS